MNKSKVVLITGSSQGIGRAIAMKFAAAGFQIALNDVSFQEDNLKKLKSEIEAGGATAEYFFADVSKLEEVEAMVGEVVKTFGGIDILVNNAGIMGKSTK